MTRRPHPIHVLVVDDSAVMREVMLQLLSREPGMMVTVAADPIIALEKMGKGRPDVILLDLELPRVDGLTFLRQLMAEAPLPVVVCSGLAATGSEMALRALEEGAVDVIAKPRIGLKDFLHESRALLIEAIQGAAQARPRSRVPRAAPPRRTPPALPPARPPLYRTTQKVIAMGASTGGTEALRTILEAMPVDAPGIVIVQHMPEAYTASYARRLNELCRIEVKEAERGDRVIDGRALVARGNRHLVVERSGATYVVDLVDGPPVCHHRPSVNVLFQSVAATAGPNALGVILTGMGDDGADGLHAMKEAGGVTLAQDEATSVVFGMPKEAIERGAVETVLPLDRIPGELLRLARAWSPNEPREGRFP